MCQQPYEGGFSPKGSHWACQNVLRGTWAEKPLPAPAAISGRCFLFGDY